MTSTKIRKLRIIGSVPIIIQSTSNVNEKRHINAKTKKKKTEITYREKAKLWDIYDLDKIILHQQMKLNVYIQRLKITIYV